MSKGKGNLLKKDRKGNKETGRPLKKQKKKRGRSRKSGSRGPRKGELKGVERERTQNGGRKSRRRG